MKMDSRKPSQFRPEGIRMSKRDDIEQEEYIKAWNRRKAEKKNARKVRKEFRRKRICELLHEFKGNHDEKGGDKRT